jgi:hypothetical protein
MAEGASIMPVLGVLGLVAFVVLVALFAMRRGKPIELSFTRPSGVPTESGGPGGAFPPDSEWQGLSTLRHDTTPAPALPPPSALPAAQCKVCPAPATRMTPASGRGERMRNGGIPLGAGVEMDHHGDRLYGQPRPEIIHTAPGSDLCETHELVAFRLLERFHAGQRARMSELTGELALEAAGFEGGGLMRELSRLSNGKGRGKAKA